MVKVSQYLYSCEIGWAMLCLLHITIIQVCVCRAAMAKVLTCRKRNPDIVTTRLVKPYVAQLSLKEFANPPKVLINGISVLSTMGEISTIEHREELESYKSKGISRCYKKPFVPSRLQYITDTVCTSNPLKRANSSPRR